MIHLLHKRVFPKVIFPSRKFATGPATPPAIVLRPYQQEAIDAVVSALRRGVSRPAVVLATGGGKTMVFSHLIPQIPTPTPQNGDKTLILAHTEELVRQAALSVAAVNPGLNVQVDMRHLTPDEHADVVVASVPTLVRMTRLRRYVPRQYKAIILDECHHAPAASWTKILGHFADGECSPYVVGFTATMERSDGKSLGAVFNEIVFERSLLTMIENNELVDIKLSSMNMDVDLSLVQQTALDYHAPSLSRAMNRDHINVALALAYNQLQQSHRLRSSLVFCVDVNHCRTLCAVLQHHGINAQYVSGDTTKTERQAIIADFKRGAIDVLCNVHVFTEGTDMPNIDSIFLVRPTKSRPLLVQMIGRGLRLHPGKTHCHIVDIVGTTGTGVQSVPSLFALPSNHNSNGKSFKELNKDATEYAERQAQLARELEALAREQAEKVADLKQQLAIEFDTVDGFAALQAKDVAEFQRSRSVNNALRTSSITWLRLDYDVWGYPIDNRFFIIRREPNTTFSLVLGSFTSQAQKAASGFKCGKFNKEQMILNEGNLNGIIAKAEVLRREMVPGFGFRSRVPRPVSQKQRLLLRSKFEARIKQYYGEATAVRLEKLDESLGQYSQTKASEMLFAMMYSAKSYCVRWELQRVLGIDSRSQKQMKKVVELYVEGVVT